MYLWTTWFNQMKASQHWKRHFLTYSRLKTCFISSGVFQWSLGRIHQSWWWTWSWETNRGNLLLFPSAALTCRSSPSGLSERSPTRSWLSLTANWYLRSGRPPVGEEGRRRKRRADGGGREDSRSGERQPAFSTSGTGAWRRSWCSGSPRALRSRCSTVMNRWWFNWQKHHVWVWKFYEMVTVYNERCILTSLEFQPCWN